MNKPITPNMLQRLARAFCGPVNNEHDRFQKRMYLTGLEDGVRFASLHYGYGDKMTKRILQLLKEKPQLEFNAVCELAIKELGQ